MRGGRPSTAFCIGRFTVSTCVIRSTFAAIGCVRGHHQMVHRRPGMSGGHSRAVAEPTLQTNKLSSAHVSVVCAGSRSLDLAVQRPGRLPEGPHLKAWPQAQLTAINCCKTDSHHSLLQRQQTQKMYTATGQFLSVQVW